MFVHVFVVMLGLEFYSPLSWEIPPSPQKSHLKNDLLSSNFQTLKKTIISIRFLVIGFLISFLRKFGTYPCYIYHIYCFTNIFISDKVTFYGFANHYPYRGSILFQQEANTVTHIALIYTKLQRKSPNKHIS